MADYVRIPIRNTEHKRLVQMQNQLQGQIDSYLSRPSLSDVIKYLLDQQEIENMTPEKNLTDNAWVNRVNELHQMVADLPERVTTKADIDYYLTSPDFFETPDFDNADKTVLRQEMQRQYGIE